MQSVKFARIRSVMDPDRYEEHTGTYYVGEHYVHSPYVYHPRRFYGVRAGVTVAPGTHPNRRNANYIVSEAHVTGPAARRLLTGHAAGYLRRPRKPE